MLPIPTPTSPRATKSPEGGELRERPRDLVAKHAAQVAERPAFDQIYEEHFAFVWRSLLRLGVNQSAIDDAVQDVFIVALRRAAEFRGEASYRTWLFGIAANVARSQRRKFQRSAEQQLLNEDIAASEPSPLDRLDQRRALQLVEAFLNTLDDDRREVFVLAELEQMAAPEISLALGVKLNTVYSRLRIAREAFERFMRLAQGKRP